MTDEEMISALTAKGYRVHPPITQDTCKHPRRRGSAGSGTGGNFIEWWCLDCGKHDRYESMPTTDQLSIMNAQLQN